MADYIKMDIGSGIELLSVNAGRFKTNEIAVSFYMPLNSEEASLNAIVPMLLSRCSGEYPSIAELNRKLAVLYGASVNGSVVKVGEAQLLRLGITALDDRFSLDNESIAQECLSLLLNLCFEPKLDENGLFFESDVEREKRVLIEAIESEENEKRSYALRQAEKIMFEGEAYAVSEYGSKSSVSDITASAATKQWKKLLGQAKVLVTLIGSISAESVRSLVSERFGSICREYKGIAPTVFKLEAEKIKEKTESIAVNQGKLVIGYRIDTVPDKKMQAAFRSFCDIFGGGPYSKLFANVREKMSLCYYCMSRYKRAKNYIMIQSGCEEENMDKAIAEINNQLEEIKCGNFDYEFSSSKKGLTDAINSVYDQPISLEMWYSAQGLDGEYVSPRKSAALNDAVTKEEIMECAGHIKLDTVYRLVSSNEREGEE